MCFLVKGEVAMSEVKGRIHSFQSLGAVDGPGIRYVIFMQGCPYTCPYCHNPDTKAFSGGELYTAEEIANKMKRYKTYFGTEGGVTVSGGEPLMQCDFLIDLFDRLHSEGINTAIDTAAIKPNEKVREVLKRTDTVLCDIKFPTNELYEKYIGQSLDTVKEFLCVCNELERDVIIRHVVVPGLTDGEESVNEIIRLAHNVKHLKKIELLPFKKLCVEKYDRLGLPFPLADTPECSAETIDRLRQLVIKTK